MKPKHVRGSFMFDRISWEIFKKTGDINAYLLYIDIKKLNGINVKDIKACSDNNSNSAYPC